MIFTTLIRVLFGSHLRFGPRCRVLSTDKVNQGSDVAQEAVYENTDMHGATLNKPSVIAYDNSAYVSAQQSGVMPIENVSEKLYGQQNHSASKSVHLSSDLYQEETLPPIEKMNC